VVGLTVGTVILGVLALLSPLGAAETPGPRAGFLLALSAAFEVLHGIRRSTAAARRQASLGALISMVIALLLVNAPYIAGAAVLLVMAGFFLVDAARYALGALRAADRSSRAYAGLAGLGNLAVALLLIAGREWTMAWTVAVAVALRIFGIAWNIAISPVHTAADAEETVVAELGFADNLRVAAMVADVEASESARAPVDRGWTIAFIATLFAIHIGRMGADRTLLGLLAPGVAVTGDMLVAALITLLVINPLYLLWRWPTRWLERPMWRWHLGRDEEGPRRWIARMAAAWLRRRLRFAVRMRAARYSIRSALFQALQQGLPLAAVIAATVPVWGMSWYFDTENWAAGMWNSWAESRTDTWREAMVRAVLSDDAVRGQALPFAVRPDGVGAEDFSFIVIGDTGEGDASQHILRDQLLAVAGRPDVRFVVISSDVVYPVGAMKDYEAKFWLPFKGVAKPVYAIPGNHDWYDALEAFAATFFEPAAARATIRARVETDHRLTSTTDDRTSGLIDRAAHLRQLYGVPTGFQRAPFFEVQTDRFALIAVDTGVVKRVDPVQRTWLESALERSQGKVTMTVLGHPFFAGGREQTAGYDDFLELKRLLLDRGVTIVMAGDTHDLEYYVEARTDKPPVHHFVNGGGGAYLSFGTSLAWPARPATSGWAFYPETAAVMAKIETETPWWKRPAWWWTRQFGAWPFSAEWLSAAFDYNVAPFFQSFVEVRVEPSSDRIVLRPYGVHGRLTWGDLGSSETVRPTGATRQTPVEWTVSMLSK
jgi:hypothetical protein